MGVKTKVNLESKHDYPMHPELQIGSKFPDFELPDKSGEMYKLSQLVRGFPTALIFSRGWFCPKDRRQLQNYVDYLQPELGVNYCNMVTVSVDDKFTTMEVRDQLDANWTFLSDPDREVLHDLQMVDTTDKHHGEIYIPYTFILDRNQTIFKIYNGWWFLGRPTAEELRMDFRALMSQQPDWVHSQDQTYLGG